MGCKCKKIYLVKTEIEKLESAKELVENAVSSMENTINSLKVSASYYETGALFNNIQGVTAQSIRESYDVSKVSIEKAKKAVIKAISDAKRELESLEREDKAYHKKHKH